MYSSVKVEEFDSSASKARMLIEKYPCDYKRMTTHGQGMFWEQCWEQLGVMESQMREARGMLEKTAGRLLARNEDIVQLRIALLRQQWLLPAGIQPVDYRRVQRATDDERGLLPRELRANPLLRAWRWREENPQLVQTINRPVGGPYLDYHLFDCGCYNCEEGASNGGSAEAERVNNENNNG